MDNASSTPPSPPSGPITRARAKAIQEKVNSFLYMCDFDPIMNGMLPHANALCILRYEPQGRLHRSMKDGQEDGQVQGQEEAPSPAGTPPGTYRGPYRASRSYAHRPAPSRYSARSCTGPAEPPCTASHPAGIVAGGIPGCIPGRTGTPPSLRIRPI